MKNKNPNDGYINNYWCSLYLVTKYNKYNKYNKYKHKYIKIKTKNMCF